MSSPQTPEDYEAKIEQVRTQDPRYRADAYHFVLAALEFEMQRLGLRRHLTGQELARAIRDLACKQYGLMARLVLESWGCRSTDDFGNIVYNLIQAKLLSKTEQDRLEDFHAVYDFETAFQTEFRPDSETEKWNRK